MTCLNQADIQTHLAKDGEKNATWERVSRFSMDKVVPMHLESIDKMKAKMKEVERKLKNELERNGDDAKLIKSMNVISFGSIDI